MNVVTAIHQPAEYGSGNVKKFRGSDPPEFRFTEDDADTLNIQAVKDRKDAYR